MSFFATSKKDNYLGIDIGTSGIKVVELKAEKNSPVLVDYGFSENLRVNDMDWRNDTHHIAKVITEICRKMGTTTKNAIAALPTFSVFSSIISLPDIPRKEFDSAIHWEAKKVIPLPLQEMSLDWRELKSDPSKKSNRILLIGAPKTLVSKQIEIFKIAKMNLLYLETETFSLIRSIIGNDQSSVALVEIGLSTSDISIIDEGVPVFSRSIDVGGESITHAVQNNLNIGLERAEQFKYDLGISVKNEKTSSVVPETIKSAIKPILDEIKYAIDIFEKKDKKVEKIILSGGSSLIIGLSEYLSDELNINVLIGNPWSRIEYPEDLKPLLNEIGPRLAVSVGLAMRGFDK